MRGSRGFTLVEVLVALTVSALVLTMAHRVTAGVIDGVRAAERAQEGLDREANARRLLTTLVGSIDVQPGNGTAFRGEPQQVAFPTWRDDARGWPERVEAQIRVQGDTLVAEVGAHGALSLRTGVRAVAFDYLLARGADTRWVRGWMSEASAPEAIRVRVTELTGAADTLLLLVGDRG